MAKTVPFIIAIFGLILLVGGLSTYLAKAGSTVVCEACGMEIVKDDISTLRIASSEGEVHWACCPVCAMVVSMYYKDATIHANCFSCGENIAIGFANGNITSAIPSDETYNVTMVFGMSCIKNKLVCSNSCANQVRAAYDWASGLPTKTMDQTFSIAGSKYSQFTIGYKPIHVPTITYGLIISGAALLLLAPLEYVTVEKKKAIKGEQK